jgi:ABC-2 type transport system ATP-binding protein
MTAILQSRALSLRYGKRRALTDCTLSIPGGHVVALVGPNGAGKTTLLNLAVGMLTPTSGTIEVLGGRPGSGREQLAKVGFVAQDTPTYAGFTVADHLNLGAHLNPGWDADLAGARIKRIGLDPGQRVGTMSGGQRAQLALTLAIAKKPELLVLDEPIASLDPLARREFLHNLREFTAEQKVSVVMSSHLVGDLERVCDYLIVLVASRVHVAGEVSELLASHRHIIGSPREDATMPASWRVISRIATGQQSTTLIRTGGHGDDPAWPVVQVNLEDLVLGYLSQVVPEHNRETAMEEPQ